MGIRFYCPNGHKMNVKEYQAGKKGICPTCGATMLIPLESTRPSSREEKRLRRRAAGQAADTSAAPGEAASSPPLPPNASTPTMPPDQAMPAEPVAAPPVAAVADPLADAGEAVWYVRPPSGGQYGPAPAELMRVWLAEGRITADCLVWREGWRDWRKAAEVFPQTTTAGGSQSVFEAMFDEEAFKDASAFAYTPGKPPPQPRHMPRWVIALLVIAAILFLVWVFVWFLMHEPGDAGAAAPQSASTALLPHGYS